MAHNLMLSKQFGAAFFNRGDVPAWHGLGILKQEDITAEAALRRFGLFGIQKKVLKFTLGQKVMKSGYYALLREPTADDPEYRVIGKPVSEGYEVIEPLDVAQMWDKAMIDASGAAIPIETLGLLGRGERMFVSTCLPYEFDIKGDPVKTYLLFDAPFHNGVAIGGYTTGVRVVCQNTLNLGIQASVQQFQVTHTKGAAERCAKWIGGMYARSLAAAQVLKEAYTFLAEKPLKTPQVKWIINQTYPLPRPPQEDSPSARLPFAVRQEGYEKLVLRIEKLQGSVFDLYNGAGVGMDSPAVTGNAYGVLQAVSEMETWGRRSPLEARVTGLMNGNGALRIHNAYVLALNADRYETASLASLKLHSAEEEAEAEYVGQ